MSTSTSGVCDITAGEPSSFAAAAALTGVVSDSALSLLLVGIVGFALGYYTRRRIA